MSKAIKTPNFHRLAKIALIAILAFSIWPSIALAGNAIPTVNGPNRFQAIQVDALRHEWWMASWAKDEIVCSFFADHEGLPTLEDVQSACSEEVFKKWRSSRQACTEKDPKDCPGYYFIEISQQPIAKELVIKLPPPTVLIHLENCKEDENGWCTEQPTLVLRGIESLPNERIIRISGFAGDDRFDCDGDQCIFKLSKTGDEGIRLTFWADSTYGDSSPVFEAVVRVSKNPDDKHLIDRWQVDVFSTQWDGPEIASCAAVWETFRPVEGIPQWLRTPKSGRQLQSKIPYEYLAANLIRQGVSDASGCDNNGFAEDGSVSGCGMDAAKADVLEWQNRFDKVILNVAREKDVPAQLLKNLFSRESQFWPGVFRNGGDVGLGQMTEGGADTALLWNPAFYATFCPLVLDADICAANGYAKLPAYQQQLLQGALISSVDARCADCPLGLDLTKADFSVGIFAHTLLANCEQAGKIVENITDEKPGNLLDYETMWKLTLVNYNAGSGCLGDAVTNAYDLSADPILSWDRISANLDTFCPGSTDYVADVSRDAEPIQ